MKFLLPLILIFQSSAFANHSNIREDYNRCGICHASPSGGGTLTNYGRTAGTLMSTVQDEKLARSGFGLFQSDSIYMGGDFRYADLADRRFLMQAEVEPALTFGGLYLVGSGGTYNGKAESRKHYVMWRNQHFSVRAGKFFRTYGLMLEDHTALIRQGLGFGQGKETYNVEIAFHEEIGELFLGAFTGLSGSGGHVRVTAAILKNLVLGLSGSYESQLDDTQVFRYGIHFMAGKESFYTLIEIDADSKVNPDRSWQTKPYSYLRLGSFVIDGVEVRLTREDHYDLTANTSQTRIGVFHIPVPHLELSYEFGIVKSPGYNRNLNIFLIHFWL